MASGLKVLGIDSLSGKTIFQSFVTILAMSVTSSCLYDLWKLIPTIFLERPVVMDWNNILLYSIPIVAAAGWFYFIYITYSRYRKGSDEKEKPKYLRPHRGIVIVLSAPKGTTPNEIITRIEAEKETQTPEPLFEIFGIGQLFKGLYVHKDELQYIWPIVTNESAKFIPCFESFLKKFIPTAQIMKSGKEGGSYLLEGKTDQQQILETKQLMKNIFSEEERDRTGLERTDIIVDFSGGPKHITIGLIFGALDSDIDFQYTEQKGNTVIPLKIDHRIILDKTSEFLLEMHQKLNDDTPKDEKKA